MNNSKQVVFNKYSGNGRIIIHFFLNEYNKASFYDWGQSMLALKSITKDYPVGDTKVTALNEIGLASRNHKFISILGHSGCEKPPC